MKREFFPSPHLSHENTLTMTNNMNKGTIITHKRRRTDGKGSALKSHNPEKDDKCNADDSNSSAAASPKATTSWARKNNYLPIPSDKLVYGTCPNVSSRYEKLGRIGEGTYGVSIIFIL